MPDNRDADERPIAYLLFCSTSAGSPKNYERIYARGQFDLGRNEVKTALGVKARTVSTHHLRFRCIVYDDDDEQEIAPMIYFRVLSFNSVELMRLGAGHNTGVTVSKGHGDVLLSAGDELKLTPAVYLRFQYHRSIRINNALDDFQRAEAKCFEDQFCLTGRRLGVGGQASVYIAVKQSTKRQVACKAVPLPQTGDCMNDNRDRNLCLTVAQREVKLRKQRRDLAREYTILEKLNHPNVVSLEKVICASYDVYIFQELVTGGDLLSYLDQKGPLAEPQAAVIVLQLLNAVNYLHSHGVTHRDIKPENVLMTSWRDGARVVLTDFGQAKLIDGTSSARKSLKMLRMQTIVGTFGYTAPEIFQQMKENVQQKGYSEAVDIWSVGCVTSALLTGDSIFPQDKSDLATASKPPSESICRKRWDVNIIDSHLLWINITRKAKGFVKGCLATDAASRLTAKQALVHDWLTNKHYGADLKALYARAIAEWQPRKYSGSLVEFINTADAVSINHKNGEAKPTTAETQSQYFQTVPQSPFMPPSPMKNAPGPNTSQQHPHLPPMSRDTKQTSSIIAPSAPYAFESTSGSPIKHTKDFRSTSFTTDASTAPLSILQYGPAQTQSTIQVQQRLKRDNNVKQSRPMLDEPTQAGFTPLSNGKECVRDEERIVESQETQVPASADKDHDGRPRKKVCC